MRPSAAIRHRPQPALGAERLERRDVPTGVVGVSTNPASRTVTLTGDQWGNGIEWTRQGSAYVFAPVFRAGAPTLITHQGRTTSGSVTIDASRFPNVRFDLLGGDDGVRIRGASANSRMQVAGTVQVSGGLGQDFVGIENVRFEGAVQIMTSWGNDLVTVAGTVFHSSSGVVISSGNDDDRVAFCDVVSDPNCRVSIDLGAGVDEVAVERSFFYSLLIDTGTTPRTIRTGFVSGLFVRG